MELLTLIPVEGSSMHQSMPHWGIVDMDPARLKTSTGSIFGKNRKINKEHPKQKSMPITKPLIYIKIMVPRTGIEPVRPLQPADFKSAVSTNFTIEAFNGLSQVREWQWAGLRTNRNAPVSDERGVCSERLEARPGVEPG